jgi:hypothetical protein
MGEISVSGKLPAGDGNGLVAIYRQLIQQALGEIPPALHVCVALVDCRKLNVDGDTHETVPVARIRRIEVIGRSEDKKVAEDLMRRALDERTGRETLPYDLDEELRRIVDNPDALAATDEHMQGELSEEHAADDGSTTGNEPQDDVDTSGWPDDPSTLADETGEENDESDDELCTRSRSTGYRGTRPAAGRCCRWAATWSMTAGTWPTPTVRAAQWAPCARCCMTGTSRSLIRGRSGAVPEMARWGCWGVTRTTRLCRTC